MATGVRISAKRRFGQFLVTSPADVTLDGAPAGHVKWSGSGTSFDTAPGHHTVAMSFRYLGRACGAASLEVDVAPEQEVALLYRSPWVVTGKGTLTVQ